MPTKTERTADSQVIVVIHGLGGHRWIMIPLCRRLREIGFEVINWGYRSLWKDVPQHAASFRNLLDELEARTDISNYHIVAHSMGSIVTRVALQSGKLAGLQRIVMLCPPNAGSHMATRFTPWFGWLSTTLRQIQDTPDSFVNGLDTDLGQQYEVGIVQAATDLVVARECTTLESAQDTTLVPGFHSSMLVRRRTARIVANFIRHGSFHDATGQDAIGDDAMGGTNKPPTVATAPSTPTTNSNH